jgi:hypothetical protein
MKRVIFPRTFLTAWFALDRLATSPPNPISARSFDLTHRWIPACDRVQPDR